jgi:L-phenylalanine/L-methionine N-acetyltransferase
MNLVIRPVGEPDHEAIHEILTSPHVLRGSMRVPYSPIGQTRERLSFHRGTYQLAAQSADRVVGFGELITYPDEPRQWHVGEINMVATSADSLGKGVGRALMEAMIDLADNWLTSPASV